MDIDVPPIRDTPVTAMFKRDDGSVIVVSLFTPNWISWFSDVSDAISSAATTAPFTNTTAGLAPASGGGVTKFLRADGTWAVP